MAKAERYQSRLTDTTKIALVDANKPQKLTRYYSPELKVLVRQLLEAREDFAAAKQGFYGRLLTEFDEDRELWLKAVK